MKLKKSYWKNLLREVRHTLSRFLAIFAIVALGVGFLAGLMSTAPDMRLSAEVFYDETRLMDLRILSLRGFSADDAEAVRQVEGVQAVTLSYAVDALVTGADGEQAAARILSQPYLDPDIAGQNQGVLQEGRLPAKDGECALQVGRGIVQTSLGDVVRLSRENTGLASALAFSEFTVVGIVNNPLYFSMERESGTVGNGTIDMVLYVDESAFPQGTYTDLYVQVKNAAALDSFSAEYKNALEPVADRLEKLAETRSAPWRVLGRESLVSHESFAGNALKVEAIAKVFPLFFYLVAALVSLTTMTRMVEEQRSQIGIMMALGYSRGAIATRSLLYAAAASALGSVFGLLLGLRIFPSVIWDVYKILYTLPPLVFGFNAQYALLSASSAVLITMLATYAACRSSVSERPASLLLPRAPKPGKRVFLEKFPWLWNPMKFTVKVTARNLLRYKKRFFMTVFGIAGCTALLLSGFGLRDAIGEIVTAQFQSIFRYNLTVDISDSRLLDSPDLQDLLARSVEDMLPVHYENCTIALKDKESSLVMTVPQQASRLEKFISLRERRTGRAIELGETSIVLTEKAASDLGARTGSVVVMTNAAGKEAELTVGGITENYVFNFAYLSPELYRSAYAEEPASQRLLCIANDTSQDSQDTVTSALLKINGVRAVQYSASIVDMFSDIIGNLDYIVMVLIITAGILALVVLYNLTNINIAERVREIATIKVLGFFDREVSAYIYRETAVLTLIGGLAGLVLGVFLNIYVVRTAEVDLVMFGRVIKPLSFAMAMGITLFFSLIVSLIMHRKLKGIDIAASMKSGE